MNVNGPFVQTILEVIRYAGEICHCTNLNHYVVTSYFSFMLSMIYLVSSFVSTFIDVWIVVV